MESQLNSKIDLNNDIKHDLDEKVKKVLESKPPMTEPRDIPPRQDNSTAINQKTQLLENISPPLDSVSNFNLTQKVRGGSTSALSSIKTPTGHADQQP